MMGATTEADAAGADVGPDKRTGTDGDESAEKSAAEWLVQLRAEFPQWAFLHYSWSSVWIAVRGRVLIEVHKSAIELRYALRTRRSLAPTLSRGAVGTDGPPRAS